jgi:hypothetical protein
MILSNEQEKKLYSQLSFATDFCNASLLVRFYKGTNKEISLSSAGFFFITFD